MTPPIVPGQQREWWTRPRLILPILASVLLLLALLTPESRSGRVGDARLSGRMSGPLGARALADLSRRLGWSVILRDSLRAAAPVAGRTVHGVLAPPLPMTAGEAHRYLEAVRAGDALLLVLAGRTPLTDSLGVRHSRSGGVLRVAQADSAGCGERGRDFTPMLWPDRQVHLYALRWPRGEPNGLVSFAQVAMPIAGDSRVTRAASATQEAVAGFPLGRGRVVVVADPDLLRNDVIRRCEWGADVVAVRALEWLAAGGAMRRTVLELDEYHQGFGARPSVMSVTRRFLATHPAGRAILQLTAAALLLLAAVAPRPIAPRPRPRGERRDPLEQVDALAHAYQQVSAVRTGTARLLGGVRARIERSLGGGRMRDDETFLAHAAADHPALEPDVALVRRALRDADAGLSLSDVGAALRRIESSLTLTTSART